MADNTPQNGTANIATDDIAGVHYPISKIAHGPADAAPVHASATNPFPVVQPDITASGTLLLLNDVVPITLNGDGAWAIDLSGFAGHVVTFESQVNSGGTWRAINAALQGVGSLSSTASADGTYRGAAAALAGIRARLSTLGTGMVTASLRASVSSAGVFQMAATPAGTNLIGYIEGTAGALLARDGTDITTPTAMPAGGVGIRGWLSSIWTKLNGILSVVITSNGLISTNNSSSTPLGIGGVLTCTSDDVTEWGEARVSVFADQASATDGLQMQQSSNGTNWDVIDSYTIPANTGKTFSVALTLKHFRVVNTNGGVAQGVMRLQTKYFKSYNRGSSVRPQDARANDNDFEEVLGFQMVYNGISWDRQRGDAANGARMQMTPVISATTLSAANTTVTLTIPVAGAGLFTYLTRVRITNHNTSATAVAGSAVTLAYTSTNIPTGLAWTEGNALAAGTSKTVVDEVLENAIKTTTANTATTIVAPAAGTGVLVRITVYYYTGP